MRPLRMSRLLGTACLLLLGMLVAAPALADARPAPREDTAPSGGIGLRLLDAPTAAVDDDRARLYIVDHLAPGTRIERRIEVSNTTDSPETVALYAAAATIDDGVFVGASGRTANELSSWATVTPDRSSIPADGSLTAAVAIDVPADAAPGEQYGVIWAEVRSDQTEASGVVQVGRVGIRLYVSVGPGGAPAADFSITSLTAGRSPEGHPTVSALVGNTGGRAIDMSGTLQLTDGPGALSAGPFPADLGRTLAIGETQPVTVTLDENLPAGPWEAQLILRSGLIERAAEATITFPRSGIATPVAVTEADPRPWLSIPAAIGLFLLLVVLVVALRRRTRQRDRSAAGGSARTPRHGLSGSVPEVMVADSQVGARGLEWRDRRDRLKRAAPTADDRSEALRGTPGRDHSADERGPRRLDATSLRHETRDPS